MQCLEKIFQSNGHQLFAPEDLIQLQLGMSYYKASNASQIFAIGMTVLSAVTLKESFTLYNLKTKRLNFNQALIRIQQMRDMPHYSDTLNAVVELMCAFEVNDRLQMQEIGEILFRCESSIKLKRKFVAYPFGQKIENKLREYRSIQRVSFKARTLSIMSSIGPNELNLQSPQNSKLAQLKRNSMDLTQVILGPQTHTNKKKSSNNTDSLMSSDQLVTFKKTQSDPKEEKEKPLQRYQEINANFGSNSLTNMDYLHLINMAKQVIIQKPVVIDTKRRSDDIIEEVTPVETPDQSHAGQENQGFGRQFLVPKQYSRESIHFNFVQKNPLSKTTNVNFRPNESHHQKTFKVKSAQSQEPEAGSSNRRQDLMRTQNSSVVVYVPINDSLDQSLKSSWQSQHFANNKPRRKILQSALPSLIQEYSREQSSQIQASKLSQKDKQYLQSKILQKLSEINIDEKKKVKFAQVQDIIDYSHESKILQIDDIGLDCIDNDGKNIFIEYKQPNKSEIVVQSVRISNKNNFLSINEDEN